MLELFEQEAEERQREAGEQFGRGHPKEEKVVINLSQANEEPPKEAAPKSRDKAARASGSSPAAVQQAKKVQDSGIPELQAAVAEGSIKVSEADKKPDRVEELEKHPPAR